MATLIDQTKNWIEKFVIGLNLCPFAKPVFDKDQIRYITVDSEKEDDQIIAFFGELKLLKKIGPKDAATSFVIFSNGLNNFDEYLTFHAKAEFILAEAKMDQTFQLASFHPDYQFEGTEKGDIENATNQSPYPMIHILRVKQVSAAIEQYPDTMTIPEKNIETLKELGKEGLEEILG